MCEIHRVQQTSIKVLWLLSGTISGILAERRFCRLGELLKNSDNFLTVVIIFLTNCWEQVLAIHKLRR